MTSYIVVAPGKEGPERPACQRPGRDMQPRSANGTRAGAREDGGGAGGGGRV